MCDKLFLLGSLYCRPLPGSLDDAGILLSSCKDCLEKMRAHTHHLILIQIPLSINEMIYNGIPSW